MPFWTWALKAGLTAGSSSPPPAPGGEEKPSAGRRLSAPPRLPRCLDDGRKWVLSAASEDAGCLGSKKRRSHGN